MSDVVIKVANLSKQYTLRHEGKERYVALRDVIARGARNIGKRLVSPFTHSAPATPDNRTEEFFALKDVSFEVPTRFHPELTGRENIYLNGAILGMSRAEIKRKFDEIVAFAETEKFLDTPVKRYSSGMYVRLAVCGGGAFPQT